MLSETIEDVLKELQKFYARPLNAENLAYYRTELAKLNEDDMCAAALEIQRQEQRFPSMAVITKYVYEAADARRRRENRAPIFADLKRNAEKTAMGLEAFRAVVELMDCKLTRKEYLLRVEELAKRYPNAGWRRTAIDLARFWGTEKERHAVGEKILAEQARRRGEVGEYVLKGKDYDARKALLLKQAAQVVIDRQIKY